MIADDTSQTGAPEGRPHPELVLASASPRRAVLLRENGYTFRISPAVHGEPDLSRAPLSPVQMAEACSYFKARSTAQGYRAGLIVAADTIVARHGSVFGKARDVEHAGEILGSLAGTTHDVITGVTLLSMPDLRRRISHAVTQVTMRRPSDAEMAAYLHGGAWEGKAGAYGIQDESDPFVERIVGSFSNVVGLPMELLIEMLASFTEYGPRPEAHGPRSDAEDP